MQGQKLLPQRKHEHQEHFSTFSDGDTLQRLAAAREWVHNQLRGEIRHNHQHRETFSSIRDRAQVYRMYCTSRKAKTAVVELRRCAHEPATNPPHFLFCLTIVCNGRDKGQDTQGGHGYSPNEGQCYTHGLQGPGSTRPRAITPMILGGPRALIINSGMVFVIGRGCGGNGFYINPGELLLLVRSGYGVCFSG